MPEAATSTRPLRLTSATGLSVELCANGALRRLDFGPVSVALFVGNELEGGPANLYLRRTDTLEWTPLLGPGSPTRFTMEPGRECVVGVGTWMNLEYSLTLLLSKQASAWFWHIQLHNRANTAIRVDLTYAQDLALAPYGAVRLNEFYVSQYIDHTALEHESHGVVLASRQNQSVDGRNPWACIGSLRRGTSFATDALQFHGLATRAGGAPAGLTGELPSSRLQHEHSMPVVRDAPVELEAGASANAGFFGFVLADHPQATSGADVAYVRSVLSLDAAQPPPGSEQLAPAHNPATLFSAAAPLQSSDLDSDALRACFSSPWRHEERDDAGTLLSFFHGPDRHVVLRQKELRVPRPHGHLLRTGHHATPDESALTSTCWMDGVFHSMLTQGHVSINRFLSTVHSYLTLFRSHGQRVFVELDGTWRLLDMPSAFEMTPVSCRWIYRHSQGEIHVRSGVEDQPHAMTLSLEVKSGAPTRFLVSHHVSLNGDDGSVPGPALWQPEAEGATLAPAPGSDVGQRFPNGSFHIAPARGTRFETLGGDELLFLDGRSREQPFLCIVTAPGMSAGLRIEGRLIEEATPQPLRLGAQDLPAPAVRVVSAPKVGEAVQAERLADIAPWFAHDAWIHYLSPRGLEQYSGGGWGTRDVCQGPVELLLALGHTAPVRDLLLRVMRQQNPDGDWPQWFMFFDRERHIRPGDSHGDIVFWPLLVLGQYLLATGDASVLDERVAYFANDVAAQGEAATVWQHCERALDVIGKRVIPGTTLASYGHGDWNDSLQPADPVMRERLCSSWTVTLHFQVLKTLAEALRLIGRETVAAGFTAQAEAIHADFQRWLHIDGVLAGYALFEDRDRVRYLLHPRDESTGVRYSALAMIHSILEDMLTPAQVREHLRLIEAHLSGPDGVRLFDRPMPYHGGPQRLFQRAETATFFGREIGLMYMHAHLRYAQALAHIGDAERFFRALCQANPIGIRSLVPTASLRQANCYYSSSDAAFCDRYEARDEYHRVCDGTVALDGGWRVYSSGAGIAFGLIMRRFLGVTCEARVVSIDPVMPPALDGMTVATTLLGHPLELQYRIGPSGCGVDAAFLNDEALPLTFRANRHRRGAAVTDRAGLRQRLKGGRNVLRIELGAAR